ncbi:hypothetical protein RYX36_021463 [Vicia faba]
MGDYPARFREHFLSALVNGSPSIKQERSEYSHGRVTIESIYYYGKLVYQDVNLRSYFGLICPPARLTSGFRLEVSTRYRISGVKVGFHIVKKRDLLYPKRTKFSKYRKGRCIRGCKLDGTKLGFGRYGTQSCRAGRLSYRAIEAARQAIIGHFHRAMSGQFRKNGKIWVRVFPDIPITGKPTIVRMGRGKGNPTG